MSLMGLTVHNCQNLKITIKFCIFRSGRHGSGGDNPSTDKRAHHNALERKRRDHIKDSFSSLRDAIPTMQVKVVLRLIFSISYTPNS